MKKFKLLFIFLNVTLLSNLSFSQVQSTGTITSIYQDYGEVTINDKDYYFDSREIIISYDGRNFSTVALQVGVRVRYSSTRDNEITEIVLLGPESVLQEMLNR